jgi:uncharacterized protein
MPPHLSRAITCMRSLCIVTVLFLQLTGCQSWQKSHATAVGLFADGRIDESRKALTKSLSQRGAEQDLLLLDRSLLDLADGQPAAAEQQLRESRRAVDHLRQLDVREKAAAVVTDDRAVAWSARTFERQMLLNLLTICSILNDGQDAFAYSLQLAELSVDTKQKTKASETPPAGSRTEIITVGNAAENPAEEQPAVLDQPLALSAWLRALVMSESSMEWQECDRALADIENFGGVHAPTPDYAESFGVRCPRGQGGLHVVALIGQSPEWVAERARPTSASLLVADRILSSTGKHSLPPTIAPVKIARPRPCVLPTAPDSLSCRLLAGPESTEPFSFSTLVDLNHVAAAEYESNRNDALARAVVRRVVKKGAVVVAKEVGQLQRGTIADVAFNVGGVAWEAMEKADLRSWRTLPCRIDTASRSLPEGEWTLRINEGRPDEREIQVRIVNGRNTLVVCILPGNQLTGRVLVGGADHGSY